MKIYLTIDFTNGSNPYLFYGTREECFKELTRWSKNYKLELIEQSIYGMNYKATENKEPLKLYWSSYWNKNKGA